MTDARLSGIVSAMPLVLDNPEQITVSEVRITSFSVVVEPLSVVVNFERGYESPDGFQSIATGTASFSQDQILAVDPDATVYDAMKTALYELLESRVGPGTIS